MEEHAQEFLANRPYRLIHHEAPYGALFISLELLMSANQMGVYAPEKLDVLEAAEGRWKFVFEQLAPGLADANGKPGRNYPCPVHGGRDGFKIFRKTSDTTSGGVCRTCGIKPDGLALVMWVNSWSFHEALQEVGSLMGVKDKHGRTAGDVQRVIPQRAVPKAASKGLSDEWVIATLRTMVQESVALTHPDAEPARLYLRSRGILVWDRPELSRFVRFHPRLTHKGPDGEKTTFPGIIGVLMSPAKQAVTVQRHFLTSKGEKAPIADPKKMFAIPSDRALPGSAIPTASPGSVIDVCEGLETALAIETATGLPVWPLVNTYLMEMFVPPAGTEEVRIWIDKDRKSAGVNAGVALKKRLWSLGVRARILEPTLDIPHGAKGVDWNDVLLWQGPAGFPGQEVYRHVR
ncbi:toprim domain-containing protein [Pseudomonas sp. DP-17]|uniref:DUF7146 domain-containing protein n=1 Tax=Pseudomonas sp. DP-17 TaxID=1580486 RepID=UPI001EFC13DA|nr:toprim domain-containing protein [Pseudomonas sp. DP-17]MCG8910953.1 toprim domain-containing protein [Pseudomonas sp. DP-17]